MFELFEKIKEAVLAIDKNAYVDWEDNEWALHNAYILTKQEYQADMQNLCAKYNIEIVDINDTYTQDLKQKSGIELDITILPAMEN